MKLLHRMTAVGLTAAFVVTLAAAQDAKKPVNKMCPVMTDHKVDVEVTVSYKGKLVGVCCTACQKKWNANPGAYAANVKEDFGAPDMPEGASTVKDAIEGGKAGGYLTAVIFADKSPKTEAFLKLFLDAGVNPEILGCAFGKIEFKKDSEEAKAYKVSAAPTLILIDPTKQPAAVLKTITSATAKSLLKDLQDAKEKLGK
ncbi:MAG TPA: hypothetical protein VNM14_11760 [Planctomycetota bacterium]|nr:hypothetical protein [Planctomycetota bacterium]